MKEVNKVYKIYQGFFGEELPEKESKKRRDICNQCPYNSRNSTEKSFLEDLRHSLSGDFCTLCKCQIKEKTGSALEECALYMIGEKKKWFKIKIETMGKKDLNFIQVDEVKRDIALDGNVLVIDLGTIDKVGKEKVNILVQGYETSNYAFKDVQVTCGCTGSGIETLNSYSAKLSLSLNKSSLSDGAGYKRVYLNYSVDGEKFKQEIKLKFFSK